MVEFGFVRVRLGIRLRDALGDHFGVTLLVTRVVAVCTLHTSRVLQEIAAQRAAHDVIELLLHKLVPVLLDHIFLSLTDSTLSAETDVEWGLVLRMLGKGHRKVDASHWLQRKPIIDHDGPCLGLRASCWPHATRTSSCAAGRTLSWWRLELEIRLDACMSSHLVCSYPPRGLQLCFDLLPAHLLGNVRNADPEHANG